MAFGWNNRGSRDSLREKENIQRQTFKRNKIKIKGELRKVNAKLIAKLICRITNSQLIFEKNEYSSR